MKILGRFQSLTSLAVALCIGSVPGWADDTEMYLSSYSYGDDYLPKVLVIFDGSGSMINNSATVKRSYDASTTYSSSSDFAPDDDYIYFTLDTESFTVDGEEQSMPDELDDFHRFAWDINNCASSYYALEEYGYFFGYIKSHEYQGNSGSWENPDTSDAATYDMIDCAEDFYLDFNASTGALDEANGTATYLNPKLSTAYQGNMVDGATWSTTEDYEYYNLSATGISEFLTGRVVTLYTANYLRWYHNDTVTEEKTRLEIAREAVSDMANVSQNIEYGLMLLNYYDGGEVLAPIQKYDDISTYTDIVEALDQGYSWTPLAETVYEAKRYLSGESMMFGYTYYGPYRNDPDQDSSGAYRTIYNGTVIDSTDGSGNYISPFSETCDENIRVLLVTDGSPTQDDDADALIQDLDVNSLEDYCTSANYVQACETVENDNYNATQDEWYMQYPYAPVDYVNTSNNNDETFLPVISAWMYENDMRSDLDGDQTATFYTIGFGDDAIADAEELLQAAAGRGGGFYNSATDSLELNAALQSVISASLDTETSSSTVAVTTNSFDKTESLDRLYYAMFDASEGPRWAGNIKKLVYSPEGYVADANGVAAIDSDGNIVDDATTYWSSAGDGNDVSEGGIVEQLTSQTNRTLYLDYDIDGDGDLEELDFAILNNRAGDNDQLVSHLGLTDVTELADHVDWILGEDVDDDDGDGNTTENRSDIFGDPLHSSPLVLNYGSTTGNVDDSDTYDVRLLIGTNAGFIHLFEDEGDSVVENWALGIYDELANQITLRENSSSDSHVYGIDGQAVSYTYDSNGDDDYFDAGDKVWAFVGQRRGGDNYYGLDLSDPDSPSLLWTINASTSGMSELGYTWSTPVVSYISAHTDSSGDALPVLIFGGGYDTNKDLASPGDDDVGRAVFIVDAETGTLLYSFTPESSSGTNINVDFEDSIPGKPAVLDSDGDGFDDRIYVGDTGGNLWRLDMPTDDSDDWGGIKLAELGGADEDDRRFFNEPAIVRTYYQEVTEVDLASGGSFYNYTDVAYDGVLIGSGDRTKPTSDLTVENHFFLIRDLDTEPMIYTTANTPDVVEIGDLYDITDGPMDGLTGDDLIDEQILYSEASGWNFELEEEGEKSFGAMLVLSGVVYATSYQPPSDSGCSVTSIGTSRMFTIDLDTGTSSYEETENILYTDLYVHSAEVYVYDENGDIVYDDDGNALTTTQLTIFGGTTGGVVVSTDGDDSTSYLCETDGNCSEGSYSVDSDLSPEQTYMYIKVIQ